MSTEAVGGTRSPGSRCVLWHAPGDLPPADLITSLERRGVVITSAASSYMAVAEACLLERANDERTTDPGDRDALVLVLVCPARLADAGAVVDAMRRYAGRTACWWYDPSANPRLRAVVEEDVREWEAERRGGTTPPVPRSPQEPETAPRLKLSGDGGGVVGPAGESGPGVGGTGGGGGGPDSGIRGPGPGMSHTKIVEPVRRGRTGESSGSGT